MPKMELEIHFVCARCKKAIEGAQVYDTIVKVKPCPCLVNDLKKEQEDGRQFLSENDLR